MNFSYSILYLLLLYAVLDDNNTLTLNTGLLIASGVLLYNCYNNNCTTATTTSDIFSAVNSL